MFFLFYAVVAPPTYDYINHLVSSKCYDYYGLGVRDIPIAVDFGFGVGLEIRAEVYGRVLIFML